MLVEDVAAVIREVATVEVLERFRSLRAGDISEKSPGDLVTIADQECERVLTPRLRSIRDVPVIGEESTAVDRALLDELGSLDGGAWRNGERIVRPTNADLSGIVKRGYMEPAAREHLASPPAEIGAEVPAVGCAGVEYAKLADGAVDFLFYYRTWPWDHSPGSLIAEEAGMRVGRLDGSEYSPGDGRNGLLTATPEVWQPLADHIRSAIEPHVARL